MNINLLLLLLLLLLLFSLLICLLFNKYHPAPAILKYTFGNNRPSLINAPTHAVNTLSEQLLH